ERFLVERGERRDVLGADPRAVQRDLGVRRRHGQRRDGPAQPLRHPAHRSILPRKKIGVRHAFLENWCLTPFFRKWVSDTNFRASWYRWRVERIDEILPDVRDGLTRKERIVLYVLHQTQQERGDRNVPTAMLWGRVCEHFYISPEELSLMLARLGARK